MGDVLQQNGFTSTRRRNNQATLTFAQWGGVRAARARYDTYRTAALSEQPPYLVTDTAQGACKQPGRGEGFYTDSVKPDLPLQWQTALLPLILVGTVVFAGLASLGQGRKEDFLLCWSTILTASASFALPLCWALPWSGLARHLQKSGCAVAGWAGAEAIGRNRSTRPNNDHIANDQLSRRYGDDVSAVDAFGLIR